MKISPKQRKESFAKVVQHCGEWLFTPIEEKDDGLAWVSMLGTKHLKSEGLFDVEHDRLYDLEGNATTLHDLLITASDAAGGKGFQSRVKLVMKCSGKTGEAMPERINILLRDDNLVNVARLILDLYDRMALMPGVVFHKGFTFLCINLQ